MYRLFQIAFWLALAVTLYFAWSPQPAAIMDDKALHALVFAVLTIGASLAWPNARWWWIALGLATLGAVIELVQLVPNLTRSASIDDWYADLTAIAVALPITQMLNRVWQQPTE